MGIAQVVGLDPKLTIELVPSTSWYTNVRSKVSAAEWDKIRHATYKKAGWKCEVCGGKGENWPVECHEIWHYDDKKRIQKLLGMISLCPLCHSVKHIGLAEVQGKYELARYQLMKVNHWTETQAQNYIHQQFEVWAERSQFNYEVDVSYLKTAFKIDVEE